MPIGDQNRDGVPDLLVVRARRPRQLAPLGVDLNLPSAGLSRPVCWLFREVHFARSAKATRLRILPRNPTFPSIYFVQAAPGTSYGALLASHREVGGAYVLFLNRSGAAVDVAFVAANASQVRACRAKVAVLGCPHAQPNPQRWLAARSRSGSRTFAPTARSLAPRELLLCVREGYCSAYEGPCACTCAGVCLEGWMDASLRPGTCSLALCRDPWGHGHRRRTVKAKRQ